MDWLDAISAEVQRGAELLTKPLHEDWHEPEAAHYELEATSTGNSSILLQRQHEVRKQFARFREDLLDGLVQAGYMFSYRSREDLLTKRDKGELRPYMACLFEEALGRLDRFTAQQFDTRTGNQYEKLRTLISLAQQSLNLPLNPDCDPALNLVGAVDFLLTNCYQEGLVREQVQARDYCEPYNRRGTTDGLCSGFYCVAA